jgi:AcrR family transcriptional regulator
MTSGTKRLSARERLLDAASELFYSEGVQTVGIDRIIEHAGVAKASLYNSFGSKEELVEAYLAERHAGTMARLDAAIAAAPDPRSAILAVFDAQAEVVAEPGFRGCAFVSASSEAAHGGLIEKAADDYREWLRSLMVRLAQEAGSRKPQVLGRQLHLIYDGVSLSGRMDRDPSVTADARGAVEALLAADLGG